VFARPVLILLAAAAIAGVPIASAHAEDAREMEARKAYAAGRYKEAVDLYSNLYAATLHPTYLRNIGRCYQNLEEPQSAIKSYQEYLRKKPNVAAAERREVEGFIAEMEVLKQRQALAATPAATPVVPAPPATPAAAAPAPGSGSTVVVSPPVPQSSSSSVDLAARAPEPEAPSAPFYTRWWFWTVVGVAAAGAGAAILLTTRGGGGGPATDLGTYSPRWE
jgi:tetratricopeptide (TPR) repeat protein